MKLHWLCNQFKKNPYSLAFFSLYRNYDKKPEKEDYHTAWGRLKIAFRRDKNQNISPEICTIFTNFTGGIFFGCIYSGFFYARYMMHTFIERNMATKYANVLDAKFRLQDNVMFFAMRGGVRWGLRIAFFTGMFTLFYSTIGVIRDNHTIWNILPAGFLSGFLYKINLGFKGMISGGIVGTFLSLIAVGLIYPILKLTGREFQEHFMWNYYIVNARDKKFSTMRQIGVPVERIPFDSESKVSYEEFVKDVEPEKQKNEDN